MDQASRLCKDGLEQEFNSLDAQRLAGENYIASQIHENWRLVSKHYDDGGVSGGNIYIKFAFQFPKFTEEKHCLRFLKRN